MVCPGVQDTRQQLQATQQQLEAELQDLATQVSTAEIKLAAEPAKQRALALQVLAITHASTQAKSKHCDLCFSRLCQQYSESCEMRLNAATTWHQTTHAAQRMRAQVEEVHTVSLLSVWSTCVAILLSSFCTIHIHSMQQQVDGLAKRKGELQAEDQRPSLGPEDQRAALLAQIKADNEACEVASQRAKQATEAVRQMERQANTAQPVR